MPGAAVDEEEKSRYSGLDSKDSSDLKHFVFNMSSRVLHLTDYLEQPRMASAFISVIYCRFRPSPLLCSNGVLKAWSILLGQKVN